MSAPVTHFTDRAEAVGAALAPAGVRPAATAAMVAADEAINAKLDELEAELAPRVAPDEFTKVGADWATGKLKTLDKARKLMAAPSVAAPSTVVVDGRIDGATGTPRRERVTVDTPEARRYALVRKGARAALIADAERDEWQVPELVASCRDDVATYYASVAANAVEGLEGLDPEARDLLGRGGGHTDKLFDNVDPATTPTNRIDAYRRVHWAWQVIDDTEGLVRIGRAMAGDIGTGPADEAHDLWAKFPTEPDELGVEVCRTYPALWLTAEGMAAMAAGGLGLLNAVLAGHGELKPLIDPLGADADELAKRLDAYTGVRSWLESRLYTDGDRMATNLFKYEGLSRDAAIKVSRRRYSLVERAGEGSVEATLAAYTAATGRTFD